MGIDILNLISDSPNPIIKDIGMENNAIINNIPPIRKIISFMILSIIIYFTIY